MGGRCNNGRRMMTIGWNLSGRRMAAFAIATGALVSAGVGLPPAGFAAPSSPLSRPPATSAEPQDLGTLGGHGARAVAVNDRGMVVGTARTAAGREHAFVWT